MTKLRLIRLLCLAPFAVYGSMLAACGDDDTVVFADAGTEGGADTGPAPDSGTDTGVDSGFDAGLKTETFDEDLAGAMCDSLARCCFGSTAPADGGLDGGASFDRAKCTAFYLRFGFNGSNRGSEFKDAGNLTLDQVKADDCLKRVKALSCDLPGADFQVARTSCFGAYTGTIPVDAPCNDNIECAPGNYCKAKDAGADAAVTRACAPLVPTNGDCGSTGNPTLGEQECSARQSGEPNHCGFYDFAADDFLPAEEWKCTPPVGVGGRCVTNTWCQNSLCDDNTFVCVTPSDYFANACANYIVKP